MYGSAVIIRHNGQIVKGLDVGHIKLPICIESLNNYAFSLMIVKICLSLQSKKIVFVVGMIVFI